MEKEIKLNQWYLKVTEYPKDDYCLFKTTELFYALEYHSQYDMYYGYYVPLFEFGFTEEFKRTNQTCFNDNKTLPITSLIEYEPISYKEAKEYIDGLLPNILTYAIRNNTKRMSTL
jgi:hypothetical protein